MRFIVLFVFLIVACNDNPKRIPGIQTALDIQKIHLRTLTDTLIDLTKLRGKVVFINFWGTRCKPCLEEMPAIKRMMDAVKKDKVEFLFASEDPNEEIETFEEAHNFEFNYVKANLAESGIMGLPTTFIFDKNGKLVFSEMGYRKWDDKPGLDLLSKIVDQQ